MEAIKGVPQPTFELAYNGKAITAEVTPYVTAITYTDNLTGESDDLDVELEDTDGRWINAWYPEKGAVLTLKFGYLGQTLVKAGVFAVDEVNLSGPPSVVKIRALATGVQEAVRTRNSKPYEKTTLAAIAQRIAKRHKMKLIGKVEALQIDRATQYHETDLQFLSRLAAEYGYAFKVTENNTKMVFWKTADLHGQKPIRTFTLADMISYNASDKITDVPGDAQVKYHDPKTKKLVVYGVKEGQTTVVGQTNAGKSASADTVKMSRRAPTKQAAEAMAAAELDRRHLDRTSAEIEIEGDAGLAAGAVIELAGLGRLSGNYTMTKVTHRITRGNGFTSSLELKRVAPPANSKVVKGTSAKPTGLKVYGVKNDQVQVVGTTNKAASK